MYDPEKGARAQHAIRDILHLYREVSFYGGISGDHDVGTFDPWEFVDDPNYGTYGNSDDVPFIMEGSAVALICDLLNELDQRGGNTESWRPGLEAGRLDHLPQAKAAIERSLNGVHLLLEAARPVYAAYVIGYLKWPVEIGTSSYPFPQFGSGREPD